MVAVNDATHNYSTRF